MPSFDVRASLTDDLKAEIQQKQTQIQELEKQITEYKTALKNTQNQSTTLKSQISKLETQIKQLEAEVRMTQIRISSTSLKIKDLATEIGIQNMELAKNKNGLGEILLAIDEADQETPFEIILKNKNLSDFLNQVQYSENLQKEVQKKVRAIKDLKTLLEGQKTDYEVQKTELESLKKQLSGKTAVLDNQKEEKNDLLATSKNQEKQYQTTLTELQKKQQQIEDEIYAAEEKLRLTINPDSLPGAKNGLLLWPIKGTLTQTYGCIQTSFARRSYPACNNKKGGYHNGIDVDADMGDPIKTADDGVISGVGNLGKYSYGKWITVNHLNGLTTLYAHLSAQSVAVGQTVKAGDIIGYAGSTGYSTGAHLHFTLYATNTFRIEQKSYGPVPLGGDLNPLLYL